jgi:hypothetical protein
MLTHTPYSEVASLTKGVVHTKKDDFTIILVGEIHSSSPTILLVEHSSKGETGTGKTSILSLFANVLAGCSPEH